MRNGETIMHKQSEHLRFKTQALENFCQAVFISCGLNQEQAMQSAEVMVAADVRGIPSHGIGRLWRYVNGLKSGLMLVDAKPEIVADTPGSLVVDAHGGMGFPVSVDTMNRIIEKAAVNGSAFGCVRDSNHFGMAGFYAMQALECDMIGIAATNKEFEHEAEAKRSGVPLFAETVASLEKISREIAVPMPRAIDP